MEQKRVYFYEKDTLKYSASIARYNFCLPFLGGKVIVDVGCGARKGPWLVSSAASKVVGLDISFEAVSYSKKNWPAKNLKYLVSDARALALQGDSFGAVLSFEVIEHIDDYKSYLKEIYRILKKEGIFIISTPNRIITSPDGIFSNPEHIREFDYQELKDVLSNYFSGTEFYGQNPSARVIRIEENRRTAAQKIKTVPVFLRHILPKKLRDVLFEVYALFLAKEKNLPSDKLISEKDFTIEKKDVEEARYFLVICKK